MQTECSPQKQPACSSTSHSQSPVSILTLSPVPPTKLVPYTSVPFLHTATGPLQLSATFERIHRVAAKIELCLLPFPTKHTCAHRPCSAPYDTTTTPCRHARPALCLHAPVHALAQAVHDLYVLQPRQLSLSITAIRSLLGLDQNLHILALSGGSSRTDFYSTAIETPLLYLFTNAAPKPG